MATQVTSAPKRSSTPFTILGVVLALLGFALVFLLGSSLTGGRAGEGAAAQQPVVVAANDIAIRTPITDKDVKVVKFAAGDVPPGGFARAEDVRNLVAAVEIKKGQALSSNLLVKAGDTVVGPQAAYLPIATGFVAMTIPTSEQQGVAGFIQPGDYISLIASVAIKGRETKNSGTVFTNVHVLRVGPAPDAATAAGSSSSQTKTGGVSSSLTIVVTQCQAEFINWFLVNESLRYTLESYKDYKPQDSAVDASCPSVASTRGGITEGDIRTKFPNLVV